MLQVITTNISCNFTFKKGNPIKWDTFIKHLKSLNIKHMVGGEAVDDSGSKYQALAAILKNGQVAYIPDRSIIDIKSNNLDDLMEIATEVYAIFTDIFKTEKRLKDNLKLIELHLIQEVEPEFAAPLEILHLITPNELFNPFKQIFDGKNLDMFTYRFYYTPSKIDNNIKTIIPWYDVQVFPQITNPDRFIFDIVCRDNEFTTSKTRCIELKDKLFEFIEDWEAMVKK
ncbi:MAG: hypothetical protein AB1665_02645 [Candidatus Thermoplasmatota archaeon]